jgi:cytochrome P450
MTPDGLAAIEEVNAYCTELALARRKQPSEARDAVNSLLGVEARTGRSFTDEEAGMHLGMLVIGGSETIAKGITLLLSLLSQFPERARPCCAVPNSSPRPSTKRSATTIRPSSCVARSRETLRFTARSSGSGRA